MDERNGRSSHGVNEDRDATSRATAMVSRGVNLRNAVVLITGGGAGIGRQMAVRAARAGADVRIWDRDGGAAGAVVEEITSRGGRARCTVLDITDRAAVVQAALAEGAVDVVVNNAGVVTGTDLLDASDEAIRRTYEVNALAPYWVTCAFLPGMIERDRGRVVTIASAAGLVGVAKQSDYSASKFAAVGFTESLRAELRRKGSGVSTLLVCPFYIDTGMFDGVRSRVPFLLPILREGEVAAKVLRAVGSGRQVLMLPPLVRLVPVLRVLPTPVFDAVMDLLGVNETMTHFTGRVVGNDTPRLPGAPIVDA